MTHLRTVIIFWAAYAGTASAEPWRDLAALLPESANAVLVVDAKNLFDSPLGRQRKWRESHAANFDRSPMLLPPIADRFILSTELNIVHFEPLWEFAAMTLEQPVTFDEIKNRVGGVGDALGGLPVVRTESGGFVVPFEDGRVGLIRLAQRQWASQQVKKGRERAAPGLTTLLQGAIDTVANGEAQIAIAVSMEDAVSADDIKAAVERSTVIRRDNVNVDQVTALMSSLKGFVFTVRVDEAMKGRLEMRFAQDPAPLAKIAKPFMLDVIGGAGAVLPEFTDWIEDLNRAGISLSGDLSIAGLRRLLSLLQVDTSELEELQDDDARSEVSQRATERYVKRVTQLVRDITSGSRASNLQDQVLWTDRAAKSIARISTRGVAPKIKQLAGDVAKNLRDIVGTFNYAQERAVARARAVNPPDVEVRTEIIPTRRVTTLMGRFWTGYRPFPYFQLNVAGNMARQQQIMAEEFTKANIDARSLLAEAEKSINAMNDLVRQGATK